MLKKLLLLIIFMFPLFTSADVVVNEIAWPRKIASRLRGKMGFIFLVLMFLVPLSARADVVINEIAWMGTENSASDEWIELYNNGLDEVDLSGWSLAATDGTPIINIEERSLTIPPTIFAGGFFLLERTDDDSVLGLSANAIYVGSLANSGEVLVLKDSAGREVDRVNGGDEWKINGSAKTIGDNATKETAQIINASWQTAIATPGAANFLQLVEESSPESDQSSSAGQAPLIVYSGPPDLPNVVANAGEDIVISLGEEILFDASESREAEEYTWYMGNGEVKNGRKVAYTYKLPGVYIVTLEAKNGIIKSADQIEVTVFAGKVIINEIFFSGSAMQNGSSANSWIELYNPSTIDVNLGGWSLALGDNSFNFGPYTILRPGNYLVLGEDVTGIKLKANTTLQLNFPDGTKSDAVSIGEVVAGLSASRNGELFSWLDNPTPGTANVFKQSAPKIPKESTTPNTKHLVTESLSSPAFGVPSEGELSTSAVSLVKSNIGAEKRSSSNNSILPWVVSVFSFSFALGLFYVFWVKRKTI